MLAACAPHVIASLLQRQLDLAAFIFVRTGARFCFSTSSERWRSTDNSISLMVRHAEQ
jgi:hypothetical protein